MDDKIKHALERGRTIDITPTGRKSGQAQRIEIWFHNLDGQIYITGSPGRRNWYANLRANPAFTFHLKEGVQADLPARATPIEEESARRAIMSRLLQRLNRSQDLESWVADSPLVAVTLEGLEDTSPQTPA